MNTNGLLATLAAPRPTLMTVICPKCGATADWFTIDTASLIDAAAWEITHPCGTDAA